MNWDIWLLIGQGRLGKTGFCFLLIVFSSCQEDVFPLGLYDYQVERLLTGGSEKVWIQVINSDNCQDSVRLYFQLLANNTEDSVSISSLEPNTNCTGLDTFFIGNANASSLVTSPLFTDSLNFADGSFWLVSSITSSNAQLQSDVNSSLSLIYQE